MTDIAAGALAGLLHVFLGADHLAAVAPAAARATTRPWLPGLAWGLAHSGGTIPPLLLLMAGMPAASHPVVSGCAEIVAGALLLATGILHFTGHRHAGHAHAPATFGFMHGLAGTAALVPLILELGASQQLRPLIFLCGFALGSCCAMTGFTTAVHRAALTCALGSSLSLRWFHQAIATSCVLVGACWLYRSWTIAWPPT